MSRELPLPSGNSGGASRATRRGSGSQGPERRGLRKLMGAFRRGPRDAGRKPLQAPPEDAAWSVEPDVAALLSGLGIDHVSWPGTDFEMVLHEEPNEQVGGEGSDLAFDAYLDWRAALEEARDAYRACGGLRGAEAQLAFGVYVAALDREEQAAKVYGLLATGTRAWE